MCNGRESDQSAVMAHFTPIRLEPWLILRPPSLPSFIISRRGVGTTVYISAYLSIQFAAWLCFSTNESLSWQMGHACIDSLKDLVSIQVHLTVIK